MKNDQLPELLNDKKWLITVRVLAVILGFGFSAFAVFQILFLIKVIPHGGIW